MQATVRAYDGAGADLVLDDGRPLHADAAALRGLLLLRPGQRVQVDLDEDDRVSRVALPAG